MRIDMTTVPTQPVRTARRAHWFPPKRLPRSRLPHGAEAWITSEDSLTQRVIGACGGRFRVALLAQRRGRPARDEQRLLGMRHGEEAVLREVFLMCEERPWVYARTVIPLRSLRGRWRRIAHLGERSLGGILFADNATRRGQVEFGWVGRGAAQHIAAHGMDGRTRVPERLWGRRSIFTLCQHRLLVSEFFLPVAWGGADDA